MRNLDFRDYLRVYVPKPSSDEQKLIAQVLRIANEAQAAAQSKLTEARRLKTALMQKLFTHGIPGRHTRFQHTKWFQAPAVWKPRQLRQIAKVDAGFTMGRDLSGYETVEVAYLTVVNVQEGGFDLSDVSRVIAKQTELDGLLLRHGDILMTEGGDRDKLGRGAMWRGEIDRCVYQNHIFRVRLEANTYNPELFHYLLQTTKIVFQICSSARNSGCVPRRSALNRSVNFSSRSRLGGSPFRLSCRRSVPCGM
jgi:type I restriction enzyme S subunit